MKCEECETEIPTDSLGEMRDYIIEQQKKKMFDEMVLGVSYGCSKCGTRFDPKEVIAVPDHEKLWMRENYEQ